jgi:hypothetical protein
MILRLSAPVLVTLAACSPAPPSSPAPSSVGAAATTTTSTSVPPLPESPAALSAAMRQWEAVAGDHFSESARALETITEGTAADDESAVRAGCQRLHDTNAKELQRHLPTPDPELTTELQRMIDDMNTATHACLRFTEGRDEVDATTYQTYLSRAVEHLQRAKVILNRDLGR